MFVVFVYVPSLCCAMRSARDDGSMLCVDVGSSYLFVTARQAHIFYVCSTSLMLK